MLSLLNCMPRFHKPFTPIILSMHPGGPYNLKASTDNTPCTLAMLQLSSGSKPASLLCEERRDDDGICKQAERALLLLVIQDFLSFDLLLVSSDEMIPIPSRAERAIGCIAQKSTDQLLQQCSRLVRVRVVEGAEKHHL